MTVTLGDTLNLVASLVLILSIARLSHLNNMAIRLLRLVLASRLAMDQLKSELTEIQFQFEVGDQPKPGGGA